MSELKIPEHHQMRWLQLTQMPVLEKVPYFHDAEIGYIAEIARLTEESAAFKARAEAAEAHAAEYEKNRAQFGEILKTSEDRLAELEQQVKALEDDKRDMCCAILNRSSYKSQPEVIFEEYERIRTARLAAEGRKR